jgi:hypothetical protein
MATNILEYSYDFDPNHLNDEKALEKYRREKSLHPDALIDLADLDCGHWEVNVYETPKEKERFLNDKLSDLVDRFFSAFKR